MKKRLIIGVIVLVVLAGAGLTVIHFTKSKPKVAAKTAQNYVALGDSVASGYGLETNSDVTACYRKDEAYPNIVNHSLEMKMNDLACSGASIEKGILGPQDVNLATVPAQLDTMFAGPKPDLVTLTIGANDINWVKYISNCYTGECGTESDTAAIGTDLQTLDTNLHSVLDKIKAHYGSSEPKVIVTGYYKVFPETVPTCPDATNITQTEVDWIRAEETNLDQTISNVTLSYKFAKFVGLDFSDHELCSDDPWVQTLNGQGPFHPTDEGQLAIASAVNAMFYQFK